MTNPHAHAPRPCALWGSTFEASHVTSYGVRAIDDFDIIPASRMFQARITVGSEKWIYSSNQYESRFDAHKDMQEAVNLINQALHPPLCMKHALEIGYEFKLWEESQAFEDRPKYIFVHIETGVFHTNPLYSFVDGEIKPYGGYPLDEYDWFYPVNELGHPTHGDAEAVVNAWEGE